MFAVATTARRFLLSVCYSGSTLALGFSKFPVFPSRYPKQAIIFLFLCKLYIMYIILLLKVLQGNVIMHCFKKCLLKISYVLGIITELGIHQCTEEVSACLLGSCVLLEQRGR